LGPTVVKPNFAQAARMLGGGPADEGPEARAAWVLARGERLLDATGARIAAVTLDAEGAVVIERHRAPYRTYARPLGQARAAGAGDTFLAAMSLALAAGAGTPGASELASAAAGVVMGKDGTAVCTGDELRTCLSGAAGKVLRPPELAARLAFARRQGRRIVFTNGCFDLLHRGHVTYLTRAKALGDVLVLGVNSDRSVRELKGPGRPVTPLEDRIEVLAALSCVDHVVAFDEPTPAELIRRVRPDVFVKGGDYTREMLPEAPLVEAFGGAVQILPYVDDRSTTGIIHRIRSVERSGAP
ncbi:MAG: D-glycero-beta-D-manno-heptose 1-phosphate adenylyltransferase, partial [Candidatus Velamenicoccus archaeovorus]